MLSRAMLYCLRREVLNVLKYVHGDMQWRDHTVIAHASRSSKEALASVPLDSHDAALGQLAAVLERAVQIMGDLLAENNPAR